MKKSEEKAQWRVYRSLSGECLPEERTEENLRGVGDTRTIAIWNAVESNPEKDIGLLPVTNILNWIKERGM